MNSQEITIPVPWGHIAAKTWGHPLATRVLCLHGIQDNCDTFDKLIPLLRQGFYFVCIDLPGHGKSSHYSPGFRITLELYVLTIKRVVEHLGWKRFICIGHSMGGMTASLFTSLYSDDVERLVMIDCAGPEPEYPQDIVRTMRMMFDDLLTMERKLACRSPPTYTYEQAVELLLTKRPSKLTRESAEVLIKRSLVKSPDGNGYSFGMDQRLKIPYKMLFSPMQQMSIVHGIKCPVLYLHATLNPKQKTPENKLVRKMYKTNPNIRIVKVDGNHDVHLNQPDRIAHLIDQFLLSGHSKL